MSARKGSLPFCAKHYDASNVVVPDFTIVITTRIRVLILFLRRDA